MSRLIIASISLTSENALFRKYHDPAKVWQEAPNATNSTDLPSNCLLVRSMRDNSSIIERPEALPLAP